MSSMYETLMNLPIFNGVSIDQITLFLEKTNLLFLNFEKGEKIIEEGDRIENIKFLISGKVCARLRIGGDKITIIQQIGSNIAVGVNRLYGIHTHYPYSLSAASRVSMIQFSKEDFKRLLDTNQICMLNFINYLSLRSQKSLNFLMKTEDFKPQNTLSYLVQMYTCVDSQEIAFETTLKDLAVYLNTTENDIRQLISANKEILTYIDGKIRILDRSKFLK